MRQFKNPLYLYTTLVLGQFLANFEMGGVEGEMTRTFYLSDKNVFVSNKYIGYTY